MNWLQARLDKLGYTHIELQKKLEEQGIRRVRATITGWTNEKPVSLLNDPTETEKLAKVLKWSVLELLVAAGYDIGVPQELAPYIARYRTVPANRKEELLESLEFVLDFMSRFHKQDPPDDDSPESE